MGTKSKIQEPRIWFTVEGREPYKGEYRVLKKVPTIEQAQEFLVNYTGGFLGPLRIGRCECPAE